jgi:hypothetical protein
MGAVLGGWERLGPELDQARDLASGRGVHRDEGYCKSANVAGAVDRRRVRPRRKGRRCAWYHSLRKRRLMDVLLRVPDDIFERLPVRIEDLPRHALESLAADFYRARLLTSAEVQRMLGFQSRWQTEEFLKEKEAYLRYSAADLDRDIESFRKLADR